MDARNLLQRATAIVIVLGAAELFCPVYAELVYIYGGDFNLPIIDKPGPGSEVTEAVIHVPDRFIVRDLDVQITITHTNVFDLQLFLQSPLGSRILLNMYDFKEEFGRYPNYTDTIFDDEAQLSITRADPPFTGRFKPRAPYLLQLFDGYDSFGPWRLQVYDMFDWDTGTLDTFQLIITTPEPATLLLLGLGSLVLYRKR